ncbi:hypothetical protein Tco_1508242 [Tanacetum coccineum]
MSKVLQERGFESLSSSTEMNPRDHVKSISTAKADSTRIRHIGSGPYAVSDSQFSNEFSEIVPFPSVCFDKALFDLGASVSVMPFSTYTNLSLGDLAHTRVGEEKIVFKSIKPATSIIRRVYMLRTNLDSIAELIGEAVNESFDLHYDDYIELNDLDMPLEPRMNQDNNFEPTIDGNVIVNEPTSKYCYKMKFSCMIGYKHVNADFLPTLSINMMKKRFYNSIIKDEGDHERKKLAGTLIDIPIFVGNFSIILGFLIIDDMDITSGVVLGMPFCKKLVSCQKILEKYAHGDECEQVRDE